MTLSPAQLEQRRLARTRHGAKSEVQIQAKARAHRRRFLRQAGLRAGDLDVVTRGYLDLYARGLAALDLRDAAEAAQANPRDYWWAYQSVRRALDKLGPLLAARDDPAGGDADGFDLNRLDAAERTELARLLRKGEGDA